MTPVAELELLTRAVDGDLSAADGRDLRRLLARSADARVLFGQLKSHSARLRRLPKASPPADLAARVIARVRELPPHQPVSPAVVPFAPAARRRSWAPLAVAASLFLTLGATTFWFALRQKAAGHGAPLTADRHRSGSTGPDGKPTAVDPGLRDALPPEHGPLASRPLVPEEPQAVAVPPATRVPTPDTPPEVIPAPRIAREPTPDFLGTPAVPRSAPFETVEARLPFLALLAEVHEKPASRDRLLHELQHDSAYRVDLFSANAGRGLECVLDAARACGLTVLVDAAARERLKKKQPTAAFVVYTDGLTAAEVRDLLARLAADDAKRPTRAFDLLHLTPAQAADGRDLRDLLGVDPGLAKRADGGPKPITAGTADQVARAVAGASARPEKAAVALAFQPTNARSKPAASKELQQFLARRGDRKPSAVPLMLVIRGVN